MSDLDVALSHARWATHGRFYEALRWLCALIGATVIAMDAASLLAAYTQLQSGCAPCGSNSIQLTLDQINAIKAAGMNLQSVALYLVTVIAITQFTFAGLGALLFIRRSNDGMALFTAFMLVTFGGAAFTGTLHALPGVNRLFAAPVYGLNTIGQVSFVVFLYVFPNGRWVPRWAVLPVIVWALGWILPLIPIPSIADIGAYLTDGPIFVALILSVVAAQIYRYWRVSSPNEKQQTKWVVLGVGVGMLGFLAIIILGNVILSPDVTNAPVLTLLAQAINYTFFLLIPISIAIAILRSRLYDVDALINRTLVYGSLTAVLAALYFGLIASAQHLLQYIGGHVSSQAADSPVVIVLSTLLIVALVQPLRRRIQATIDQRFYRRKYNATRTLEQFGATLRSEVELGDLSDNLLAVIEETMQPRQVSLWLRAPQPGMEASINREGGAQ